MKKKGLFVFIGLMSLMSCTEEEITPRDYPRVVTTDVFNITNSGATFEGEVTYSSTPIVEFGFIWTTFGRPTLTNTWAEVQPLGPKAGAGGFEYTLNHRLEPGTKYYMCAYAKSSKDIVYGNELEFVAK